MNRETIEYAVGFRTARAGQLKLAEGKLPTASPLKVRRIAKLMPCLSEIF